MAKTAKEKMFEDHSDRITRTELAVEGLDNDISTLTKTVDSGFRDLRNAIEAIQTRYNEQNKTPWGVLASWASVIILLMTIIGSFYVRDLGRVERQVEGQGISILQHMAESPTRKELELEHQLLQLQLDHLEEKLNNK